MGNSGKPAGDFDGVPTPPAIVEYDERDEQAAYKIMMDEGPKEFTRGVVAEVDLTGKVLTLDYAPDAGKKFDSAKLRMDLIPVKPLQDLAAVLTTGAQKYGEHNWEKGLAWSRVYAAMLRHVMAFWDGEDRDPETGLSHLSHALCNVIFLLEYTRTHPELDDRVGSKKETI